MEPQGYQSLGEILGQTGSETTSMDSGEDRPSRKLQAAMAALQAAAELAPERGEIAPCPLCNDMGIILVREAEHAGTRYPLYQRCDCGDRPERLQWLAEAGIPPLFTEDGYDFASCRALTGVDLTAVDRVEDWVHHGGRSSLLLFGDFGVIKSTLAACAATERIMGGQRAIFTTSSDILSELRASYDHAAGGLRPSEILDALRKVPLLVIDDLGAEAIPRDAEWLQWVFYRLLGHRHDYLRPVIMTTNLGAKSGKPLAEIALRLGERTAWRLTEMIGANGVRVGGENQRRGRR